MKRLFFLTVLSLSSFSLFAQKNDCVPDKSDAVVTQYAGVYVFNGVTPKHKYEFLGQVKVSSGFEKAFGEPDSYERTIQRIIKKVKKQYPDTEGIIIHVTKENSDRADCIKFTPQ